MTKNAMIEWPLCVVIPVTILTCCKKLINFCSLDPINLFMEMEGEN
jgi:hypothetical protein